MLNYLSGQGISLDWNMTMGALVGAVPGYYRGLKSEDNAVEAELRAASIARRTLDEDVPLHEAQAAASAAKKDE